MKIELLRLNYARDWGGAPIMLRVIFLGKTADDSFEAKIREAEGEDEVLLALLGEYMPHPMVLSRKDPVGEGVMLVDNDLISIAAKDVEQAVWRLWPDAKVVMVGSKRGYAAVAYRLPAGGMFP